MRVLFAVLDDLFRFALQSLFGALRVTGGHSMEREIPQLLQPILPLLPPGKKFTEPFVRMNDEYFVVTDQAAVHLDPVVAFDNVIERLPYGTTVTVLKNGDRWAMITDKEISGWVRIDHLSDLYDEVFPTFTVGSAYGNAAQTTKMLRELINDAFNCDQANLPLMDVEYVTYRLKQAGRSIAWPQVRPRPAGDWQKILRGKQGTYLGIVPRTGTVMEAATDDQNSLFYVEAVFPDASIQVSAVGYDGLGVYSESVFKKEEWRELRPIFIEVL